jgi:GntR family transcriptional regulator
MTGLATEARYKAIAADLTRKIRSGAYRPGEALPAQRELSASYGVTLMTLRQALQELSDEGLVVQQPGRGTYVAPPQVAYRLDALRSLAEDLREQGHRVDTEVLHVSTRRPPAKVATHLGTDRVLHLRRLRRLDGEPAIHQSSWVAEPGASAIRAADFATTSLYGALAAAGHTVHRAAETITLGRLSATLAPLLRQPAGTPVFVSERVTYGLDERPMVVDLAVIAGRLALRTERAATRVTARWAVDPHIV